MRPPFSFTALCGDKKMSRPPSSNGKRFGLKNGNMSFPTGSICNPRKIVKFRK